MARRTRTAERPVAVPSLPERTSQRKFYIWGFVTLMAIFVITTLVMMSVTSSSPVAQPVDTAPVNQPAQTEPEVVAPATKEWPMVEVGWEATNISNRSPNVIAAIPVEEGLYNGDAHNTPNDFQRWEKRRVFADKILPHLGLRENNGVAVAAVRSEDVVFVHIEADGDGINGRVIPLLLSVDGEKTWCELTKVPPKTPTDVGRTSPHTRVQTDGETIRLYASDSSVGVWWWTATVKKSELPCS